MWFFHSGFRVLLRDDHRTVEETLDIVEKVRKLNKVKKLWKGVMELTEIRDIFRDEPVQLEKYDIDHFTRTGIDKIALCISCQFLIRSVDLSLRCREVDLDDLLAGIFACISYDNGDLDVCPLLDNISYRIIESRIGSAVSERIKRLDSEGIEISVAYIDTLSVVFVISIAVLT